MEFELLRWLHLAQGFGDHKCTMPMLANVLLRTQGKNQPRDRRERPEARWLCQTQALASWPSSSNARIAAVRADLAR
jgi:hypothetical protein